MYDCTTRLRDSLLGAKYSLRAQTTAISTLRCQTRFTQGPAKFKEAS